MYVRRRHRMITRRKMKKLFEDINNETIKILGNPIVYNGAGEFYYINENGNKVVVGYCTAIEDAYIDKGIPYNNVEYVLFDEFIDYEYMKDEIAMFRHTIANIVRDEERQGVKIIMLGNTVSKHCPYFDYFGFNINKIRQGEIAVIKASGGGTVAIEYTKTRISSIDGTKKKSRYFGFDGVGNDMILHGSWEYNDCNTKEIDSISWKCQRTRINAYITGLSNVYEMSYYKSKNPIAFIRSINTQNGLVSRDIKYNLSFDNSLSLHNINGVIIPKYRKISRFIDDKTVGEMELIKECIRCGRVVYENEKVGTEFSLAFNGII